MTGGAKPTVEEAVADLNRTLNEDERYTDKYEHLGMDWSRREIDFRRESVRTLLADRTALVSRIKELEGALRPFAQATPSSFIRDEEEIGFGVLVGDLRAAARVITEES